MAEWQPPGDRRGTLTGNGHRKTSRGDRDGLSLDHGGGFTGEHNCHIFSNCIFYVFEVYCTQHYTLAKSLKKTLSGRLKNPKFQKRQITSPRREEMWAFASQMKRRQETVAHSQVTRGRMSVRRTSSCCVTEENPPGSPSAETDSPSRLAAQCRGVLHNTHLTGDT